MLALLHMLSRVGYFLSAFDSVKGMLVFIKSSKKPPYVPSCPPFIIFKYFSGGRLWPAPSMLMINYFYSSRIVDSIMHLNTVLLSFIPKYKNDNVICHFAFYICFLLCFCFECSYCLMFYVINK